MLDECRSSDPVQVDLAGIQVPLYCGSVGKLYLSTFSHDDLENYLKKKLEKLTSYTVIDKTKLKKQINEARLTGIAFNYKEHQEQWCGVKHYTRCKDGCCR